MITSNIARAIARGKRQAIRTRISVRDNIEGVAAIEFAYLAPVLLVMLLGTIEVSRGISIDRRFGLVTSMVGDLVAREKTIAPSPAQSLFGIMKSAKSIMGAADSDTLKVRIMSVMALTTDTTQGKIKWAYDCTKDSCTASSSPPAGFLPAATNCSSYTLPSGIVSQYNSVIIVQSQYKFQPLFTSWTAGAGSGGTANPMTMGTWNDTSTHSPRQACVDDGNGCPTSATTCP